MGVARALRSILVADDDELLLVTMARSLRCRGIEVCAATNRVAACQLAKAHRPEAALVDLQLGRDNGLDLMRDLRALDPDIQLVLITGHSTTSNAVEAMRAGAFDVVPKPFSVVEILNRVRSESDGTLGAEIETPSVDRVVYEHVQRVLVACAGNRSEAARRLRKPRSWLVRFLKRPAPKL